MYVQKKSCSFTSNTPLASKPVLLDLSAIIVTFSPPVTVFDCLGSGGSNSLVRELSFGFRY